MTLILFLIIFHFLLVSAGSSEANLTIHVKHLPSSFSTPEVSDNRVDSADDIHHNHITHHMSNSVYDIGSYDYEIPSENHRSRNEVVQPQPGKSYDTARYTGL